MTTCEHYDPIFEEQYPTIEQIKSYKLWKCPTCEKWYSFLRINN
jgi:hypothetical protein